MKEREIFVRQPGRRTGHRHLVGWKGVFVGLYEKPAARAVWKDMLKRTVPGNGDQLCGNDNCEYDSLVDKDCRCDFEGKGITIVR